jgi:hypothetical protein
MGLWCRLFKFTLRLIKKRHPGSPMERKCKPGWLLIREKTLLTSADKCADNLGTGINYS